AARGRGFEPRGAKSCGSPPYGHTPIDTGKHADSPGHRWQTATLSTVIAVALAACKGTESPRQFTLTVQGAGTGTGTVTSAPAGINCTIRAGTTSGTCRASYISGTLVTLAATPVAGGDFSGWSGACTGTGSCVLDMTADRAVTATFIGPAGPTVLVLTPKPLIVDAGAAAATTVAVKDGSGRTIPNPTVTYVSRNSSVASV